MALLNFDATQVAPSTGYDPLPPGKYLVEITDSEMKATKAGNGEMLQLEYTVLDGEFRNRKIWDRLCLRHPNQTAVEIAEANLSAICHAVGVMKLDDSVQLHHAPLVIAVKCKIDDSTGETYNEVKSYARHESQIKTVTSPPVVSSQPNDNIPPWKR